MDRCAINFIARHWWRRVEVWVIALLLVIGGAFVGFQVAQWSLADWYGQQVAEVRRGYDEAMKHRDVRLTKLTNKTAEAATKVEAASVNAAQAADTANKAVDKADEALNRASQ